MPGGSVGVIIRPLLLMVKMYNTKLNYRNRAGATAPVSQNAKNRTFVLSQGVNAMKITVIQVNNELASTGVSGGRLCLPPPGGVRGLPPGAHAGAERRPTGLLGPHHT